MDNILNRTYFIFPYKITDEAKFETYLKNSILWKQKEDIFETNYVLEYAGKMLDKNNNKFTAYKYSDIDSLNITDLHKIMCYKMNSEVSLKTQINEISMYRFLSGVFFVELCVDYKGTSLREILYFIQLFRGLRTSRNNPNYDFEGKNPLKDALNIMLPESESGAIMCFSNRSREKMQADIYTTLDVREMDLNGMSYLQSVFYLSHGFTDTYVYVEPSKRMDASEKFVSFNDPYWDGCQDGLACISDKAPHLHQGDRLINDYHYVYLLLLNQRFASFRYVEEIAEIEHDLDSANLLNEKIISLKTSYSFRVISDDAKLQKVYQIMYQVLELDELMKDITEANERVILIQSKKDEEVKKKKETLLNFFLGGISILAISSALIDLTDYLEVFGSGKSIISFCMVLSIVIAAVAFGIKQMNSK